MLNWDVLFQNPVNKNDYLGEYTGELISHQEADKRGKIYDRANSSFLFDLNDKVSSIFLAEEKYMIVQIHQFCSSRDYIPLLNEPNRISNQTASIELMLSCIWKYKIFYEIERTSY